MIKDIENFLVNLKRYTLRSGAYGIAGMAFSSKEVLVVAVSRVVFC